MSNEKNSVADTQEKDKISIISILRGFGETLRSIFSVSGLFVAFKYLAFIGFTGVSMILSINMFMRLSDHPLERTLLIVVAGTLELYKIFSIVRGNTLNHLHLRSAAARAYAMYVVLALLSIMASYGFTLTVISRSIQVTNSSTINLQIEYSQEAQKQYESAIASLETSISTNQARLAELPKDYVTASRVLNETIAKLSANLSEQQALLSAEKGNEIELQIQAVNALKASTTTSSMFKLMAEGFQFLSSKITENILMLGLLLLISVLIELGIISTSPAIPIDRKHLKHFLDEETAARSEELLAITRGKKKKVVKRSIVGRIAEYFMRWKQDIVEVTHTPIPKLAVSSAPAITTTPEVKVEDKAPVDNFIIGSIPVRKPHVTETAVERPAITIIEDHPTAAAAPVEAKKVIENKAESPAPVTEEAETAVPVRPSVPPIRGPQYSSESKVYRFGKTTEAVKEMFVNFVHALFRTESGSTSLNTVERAASLSGVSPSLANTFITRLLDIKGSRGVALLEQQEDGSLHPNYPEGYIITYATAESGRERGK